MASVVVFGAGGLGREVGLLIEALGSTEAWDFLGYIDDAPNSAGPVLGHPVLGGVERLKPLSREFADLHVVVAVGSSSALRSIPLAIANVGASVTFPNVAHPSATVSWKHIDAGVGNIVCAGARLNNACIGSHNIINMNSVMGHDCVLGDRNLISPSATLNGEVVVGSDVMVGAGATIMPRVEIGDGATIAIGSVVGKSVNAGDTVAGNPARVVARAKA